ncbi:MAG TPA: serine hydrolase domain-containing protein [Xanthomonadaceae bacterium]|jgi:CubicO group peptidase (beta-lactamase class C family)
MRAHLLSLGIALCLAVPLAMADTPPAPNSSDVEAGTAASTPWGTTFKLPPGWTKSMQGDVMVIHPQETDFTLALLDVDAKDAASAVAAAWKAFDPGFKRTLRINAPLAPRNGWEDRAYFDYVVSPNEKMVVTAQVAHGGGRWLVELLVTSQGTAEKRSGPFDLLDGSLRPKGYTVETFAGRTAHPIDAKMIGELRQFLVHGMRAAQVPGVAFSLIDHGRIVYEGGLGVRELGKSDPVDKDTLFIAASNTKAMGTLLLAELVDEGKLRWDEPVVQAWPAFKLGSAETTRDARIKDLICACTGMPREDLGWVLESGHDTPEDAMRKLGAMEPTSKFGEVFQYSNAMAAAAGFIGGAIAEPGKELGAAYDEAMQKKVFGPLGMTRTTFDFAKAMQGDWARPHDVDIDGNPVVGVMDLNYTVVPLRPAGGMWTSAHDLSQYVMVELAKGQLPGGQRLVSEQNLMQRRVPNVVVSDGIDYGMGLMVDKRWGITVVHHGGDLAGYHSDMMWFPDYGVGAVILTNSEPGVDLRGPFLRKLAELMFDGKPQADAMLASYIEEDDSERAKLREQLRLPADPAAAAQLAARYASGELGELAVRHEGGEVYFHAGTLDSRMASKKNDDGTTSWISVSPTVQGFEFVAGEKDHKRSLILRDAQHEYVYVTQ